MFISVSYSARVPPKKKRTNGVMLKQRGVGNRERYLQVNNKKEKQNLFAFEAIENFPKNTSPLKPGGFS